MEMTPQLVAQEFDQSCQFNTGIDLYDCVETNENFFIGKQWEGVQANGLPTPVFNFLKRVVLFSVANVSTDNLKLHAKPLPSSGNVPEALIEAVTDIINDQFDSIFEFSKVSSLIREYTRNAAVDGDGCMYTYWDQDIETGQPNKGGIRTEVLQNTQVHFGNPNNRDVQSQPYIIIERRMLVKEAQKRAKANGHDENASLITADDKENGNVHMDELGGGKVTVLLRLWRDDETGTIHGYETTRQAEIRSEWDLGITLYPITWMSWDYIQDCYHGQAMLTGLIPNQIFVNKLFAMSMISLMSVAYPKIVYDRTKISKWTNKVGAAIGVAGPVGDVAKNIDPAPISPQIAQFIDIAIGYTQKFLGASDIALGDTRPDNAAAIVALQRASAVPTEITKQNLIQSIEDLGRIYMEYMAEYYGERYVEIRNPFDTKKVTIKFDFDKLKKLHFSVALDVGASAYWSEIASMQTLDNLLLNNRISTVEYLKRLPSGMISDKETLIEVLQQEQAAQMGGVATGQPGDESEIVAGEPEAIPVEGGPGDSALTRELRKTGQLPNNPQEVNNG